MTRGYPSSNVHASALTPPPSGPAPGAPLTYSLACRHCDWQVVDVPKNIAARVIVRHMEMQHGART